jgi:DNA-binding MarR family transcriptional regulator
MDYERDKQDNDIASYHTILRKNDEIAGQPRFSIMFLLYLHKGVGFTELQRLLELTPGNLDHHLKKLKKMGYISMRKAISWRPLTIVEITEEGINIFKNYVTALRTILQSID